MFLFLIPARYRPLALIIGGIAGLIAGLVASSRVLLVVGGALLVWGAIRGVARLQSHHEGRYDDRPSR